jgi:hypothetical protein
MNPRLIGGEMLLWSDLYGEHGQAPVGGAALAELLSTMCGRTLVVGPHEPSLIDAIPTDDMTVLVRGLADAEALTARYADRPGVTIWCGSLEKVAVVPTFETVVALDGLSRVCSAETADLSWRDGLTMLLSTLGTGGRLLLGMENLMGLHRLVALPSEPSDAEWSAADEYDRTRPAQLSELRHRLHQTGLDVAAAYAAYPTPTTPTALLCGEILADPQLSGFLEATLARACRWTYPVLSDPRPLASQAVRNRIAAELAPGWIVLAERAPAASAPAAPEAVVGADGIVHHVRRDTASRWTWRAGDTGQTEAVPLGSTLEDALLAAGCRRDMPRLRGLLTSWQSGEAAGVPADQVVVDDTDRLHALVPAAEPAAALHRFAATVIERGLAHLWPAPADTVELTSLLAAMAGRELEPGALIQRLDAERPAPQAVRELSMDRDRLLRELAEARAKHEWYEHMLTTRETALKRANHLNAVLKATLPGQVATTLLRTLRATVRRVTSRR